MAMINAASIAYVMQRVAKEDIESDAYLLMINVNVCTNDWNATVSNEAAIASV
jgi:hypothetical protein